MMIVSLINHFLILFFLVSCAQLKLQKIEKPKNQLKVIWNKNLDPIYEAGNLPISSHSPLLFQDLVFVGDLRGFFSVFNLENGREIWKVKETAAIVSTPVISQDQVIYGTKMGRLFSRHYFTSELKWSLELGESIEGQPFVYQDRLFVYVRDHRLVCLDVSTGKLLWSYQRSVPFTTTFQRVAPLIGYQNSVIVGFADGFIAALSVNEGLVTWETKVNFSTRFVDVDSRPLILNDKLVVTSGTMDLTFLNLNSGEIIKTLPYQSFTSPLFVNNEIIIGSVDGQIVRLDQDGQVVYQSQISTEAISSIAELDGKISASSYKGELFLLDAKSLTIFDKFMLGSYTHSNIFGQISTQQNYLGILSSRSRLYLMNTL